MTDTALATQVRKMLYRAMPMNIMAIWARENGISMERLNEAIKEAKQ